MCSARADALLITCEHGGNRVPAAYAAFFRGKKALLESHRGYDPGALAVARLLARSLGAPLHFAQTTRLLVDLNRSLGHPKLFGDELRKIDRETRQEILARHYFPYRTSVEEHIHTTTSRGKRLLHLSIHTFTPVLEGVARRADLGLLYDPQRRAEKCLAHAWKQAIGAAAPELHVRRNYPYLGKADGLTAHLRKIHGDRAYLGIEIELNQRRVASAADARRFAALLAQTLQATRQPRIG